MSDKKFYLTELRSGQCICERYKKPGYSFCYQCYRILPQTMKRDLYRKIGEGYEEAYDVALNFLKDEGVFD